MKITADSRIGFDEISLLVDGKRWFPVMGEMHFSRYPKKNWEEELCKMKAGGVDIVSLYVIWIHHEEIKGEFDFTGDRNLRDFLETVKKCGLYSILRIGPWAHGEARNGGFPDWLLKDSKEKNYETRTNAPEYLEHVKKFYEKTYEQAKGFFISEGGPIIGVQIENEYGHCGGKNGEEGEEHMRTLQKMAKDIGFVVPIYTATGWGGAVTGGMLPVMGGYCEAPWDQRLTEIEPSGNYIFTRERNDHNIGSDHGLGVGITFDMNKFPFLTAELGGGLQVTHHRRPVVSGLDTAAMSMTKMGSGANLLGYYMYHGGTNPKGKLTTLQESRATGYPNDLPEYSYDFNAPLREFGQMEDGYREVRLLSAFIHDFGSDMCDMPYVEQPGNPLKPDNLTDLRSAVRYKKVRTKEGKEYNTGYLFVNNYQRRYEMAQHSDVELKAYSEDGSILAGFAKRDIANGDFFFYPFNMPVGEKALLTIDATPVCRISDFDGEGHDAYVFYTDADREAVADINGDLDGNKIIVIKRDEVVHSSKVKIDGKEYLIVSSAEAVTEANGEVSLKYCVADAKDSTLSFRTFPSLVKVPLGFEKKESSVDVFSTYESTGKHENPGKTTLVLTSEDENSKTYSIMAEGLSKEACEVYMQLDYVGDKAKLIVDGEIATDSFYTGQLWEIGLKRYTADTFAGDVLIDALTETDKEKIYLQDWPKMKDGKACELRMLRLITQYSIKIS